MWKNQTTISSHCSRKPGIKSAFSDQVTCFIYHLDAGIMSDHLVLVSLSVSGGGDAWFCIVFTVEAEILAEGTF